jgi:hypothetical protein
MLEDSPFEKVMRWAMLLAAGQDSTLPAFLTPSCLKKGNHEEAYFAHFYCRPCLAALGCNLG